MLQNFRTVCLLQNCCLSFSHPNSSSTFEAELYRPNHHLSNLYAIIWIFKFYKSNDVEVHSQIYETRFIFEPHEENSIHNTMEMNFKELKRFIVLSLFNLREDLLTTDQRIYFPEINFTELTCGILEQILGLS